MILKAALELFSQKGFNSSSVRDIAAKVGIKDSSLYFHYKNKQAILDALLDKFIGTSEQMTSLVNGLVESIVMIDDEQFCSITEQYIQRYFMDDFIRKFIMIMNHERSHNEQLREQYNYWCIEKPIDFQMTVIEKLQNIRYFQKLDVRHMALEYYTPIFFFFNQYMNCNDTVDAKSTFSNSVMTATTHFLLVYKEKKIT